MGMFEGTIPNCPRNQHCSRWAQNYMKYCLCSAKDAASLSLGLASVISWGVAEIPQIMTNYKEKSTEGLSITFLTTWIVGDLFNLFGCLLEPATLPTQYYMAVLYTITTGVLFAQTIYYTHIYHRLKANRRGHSNKSPRHHQPEILEAANNNVFDGDKVKQGDNFTNRSSISDGGGLFSSPIPVSAPILPRYGSQGSQGTQGRDIYYVSARSLSKSHTPTAGSYLATARATERPIPTHFKDCVEEPLLDGSVSASSTPPSNTKNMLCVVSGVTFFFSSFSLRNSVNNRHNVVEEKLQQGTVIRVGRKLLQSGVALSLMHGSEGNSQIGTFFGWAMAAIYMGGRLPQIWLNIRRGHVEGLNPLMFIFALVGNATYVASILVNSMAWSRIQPNLPWLVDAGGCVLLDIFILLQFVYFHFRKSSSEETNEKDGDFITMS